MQGGHEEETIHVVLELKWGSDALFTRALLCVGLLVSDVCFEVSVEPFEAFLSHHSDSSKGLWSMAPLYLRSLSVLRGDFVAVLFLVIVPEGHDQDVLTVGDCKVALIVLTGGLEELSVLIRHVVENEFVGFSWISEFNFIIISIIGFCLS
jgi:hypothetical protein